MTSCDTTRLGVPVHHDLLAVEADTDTITALAVMREHHIRHLPVVRAGHCVGLVTETDLLRALTVSAAIPPPAVGTLCRPAPVLPPGAPRATAAAAILAGGVDAALVVRGGRLCGVLTSTDILVGVAAGTADGTDGTTGGPPDRG